MEPDPTPICFFYFFEIHSLSLSLSFSLVLMGGLRRRHRRWYLQDVMQASMICILPGGMEVKRGTRWEPLAHVSNAGSFFCGGGKETILGMDPGWRRSWDEWKNPRENERRGGDVCFLPRELVLGKWKRSEFEWKDPSFVDAHSYQWTFQFGT